MCVFCMGSDGCGQSPNQNKAVPIHSYHVLIPWSLLTPVRVPRFEPCALGINTSSRACAPGHSPAFIWDGVATKIFGLPKCTRLPPLDFTEARDFIVYTAVSDASVAACDWSGVRLW